MNVFNTKKENKDIYLKYNAKYSNGYDCKNCAYFKEAGYGNYNCEFGKPVLVVKKELITDEYYCCKGKNYKSK